MPDSKSSRSTKVFIIHHESLRRSFVLPLRNALWEAGLQPVIGKTELETGATSGGLGDLKESALAIVVLSGDLFRSRTALTQLQSASDANKVRLVLYDLEASDIPQATSRAWTAINVDVDGQRARETARNVAANLKVDDTFSSGASAISRSALNGRIDILIEAITVSILEEIKTAPVKGKSNLPFPTSATFVGREAELDDLVLKIKEDRRVVIYGPSGVGKTELALEFALTSRRSYDFVLWVDGTGASAGELRARFAGLATLLKGPRSPRAGVDWRDREAESVRIVLDALQNGLRTLLVLDNVEDSEVARNLLPPYASPAHIIVTSRAVWGRDDYSGRINLAPLRAEDVEALIIDGDGLPEKERSVLQVLAANVGFLPLGLRILRGIVREGGVSPSELLQRRKSDVGEGDIESKKAEPPLSLLLDEGFEALKAGQGVSALGQQLARDLLLVGGWFGEGSVSVPLLVAAVRETRERGGTGWVQGLMGKWSGKKSIADVFANGKAEELAYAESVPLLVRAGLVGGDGGDGVLFHTLVASHFRKKLGVKGGYAAVMSLIELGDVERDEGHFARASDWVLPSLNDGGAPPVIDLQRADLEAFVSAVALELANYVGVQGGRIAEAEELVARSKAALAAPNLNGVGGGVQGGNIERGAQSGKVDVVSVPPLLRVKIASVEAGILREKKRYTDAVALLKTAPGISAQVSGPKHPDTATGYSNLAGLLQLEGKLDEAEAAHRLALAIREEVIGKFGVETAISYNNLGVLLEEQGKFGQAEEMYRSALLAKEGSLGPKDVGLVSTLHNLAVLLARQGNLAEAEVHSKRAYEIAEAAGHPSLELVQSNLEDVKNQRKNWWRLGTGGIWRQK